MRNQQTSRLEEIYKRYTLLKEHLNEKTKRLVLAAEAEVLGWGGVSEVAKATNSSPKAIKRGKEELQQFSDKKEIGRIRKPGGGRKKAVDNEPAIREHLEALIEPLTRGDPESPLRWTCKSTRKLSAELKIIGYQISHRGVADLLHELGYSLQSNRKNKEGESHPDRNAQFEYINDLADRYQKERNPVISVDAKKKELIGNYKNNGKEWQLKGKPREVNVYDFPGEGGKVAPYGVFDIAQNIGSVNVGISSDTAEFATESIRRWWHGMGKEYYAKSNKLLITADGGGSNSSRSRLWKKELQRIANEEGLEITVCHFPPGTSKWNKIEHRLFSYISQNWRGKPLIDYETVVSLIGSTKTITGLKVHCQLDTNLYETGKKVLEEEIKNLNIVKHQFHGEWNYTIFPQKFS